ncbi:MAG TPA: hypothetical protein VGI03_04670 [Verrucomicrobiae bacterium]|jgi:hypothetical protein
MDTLKSIWAFLSVFVIAWITQRIISYWEKRKEVEKTKLSLYMSWMPFFAECYARAFEPTEEPFDKYEFVKKKMEILGILQIMGPDGAMEAFHNFCDLTEKGIRRDASFDGRKFHETFGELNCCLCCEIHGETPEKSG